MNKTVYRIITVLFVCALIIISSISVYAADNLSSSVNALGSLDDQSGYLLPDDCVSPNQIVPLPDEGGGGTLLFTMKAAQVSTFLTTYGVNGKSITTSALASNATKIGWGGTLTHTAANDSNKNNVISTGLCYYVPSTDTFYPDGRYYFTSGTYCSCSASVSSLNKNITYYGYITNMISTGYISGNLTFYYTTT